MKKDSSKKGKQNSKGNAVPDKPLKAENAALKQEKDEHAGILSKASEKRVSESDEFLKKDILNITAEISKAINNIEKFEFILTAEYETLLTLSEDKLNLIKTVIKTDNDIAYDLERFEAKVKEYMQLSKTSKTSLLDEINKMNEFYNEFEHKAGGLHIATLLKLSQLEKMKKEQASRAESELANEINMSDNPSDSILDIAQDIGSMPDYSDGAVPPADLQDKIIAEQKILSSNKGLKGFFKRLSGKKEAEQVDVTEGIKEEQKVSVDANTENLTDFFEHQKVLLEEKTKTKYAELQQDFKKRKEAELKQQEQKFKPISVVAPRVIVPAISDSSEIHRAISDVKKGKSSAMVNSSAIQGDIVNVYQKIAEAKEAIVMKNTWKAKDIYLEIQQIYNGLSESNKHLVYEPIQEVNMEMKKSESVHSDLPRVYQKIEEANKALSVLNIDKAKKIYFEIHKIYKELSRGNKHIVYNQIHELYLERKNAEKRMLDSLHS